MTRRDKQSRHAATLRGPAPIQRRDGRPSTMHDQLTTCVQDYLFSVCNAKHPCQCLKIQTLTAHDVPLPSSHDSPQPGNTRRQSFACRGGLKGKNKRLVPWGEIYPLPTFTERPSYTKGTRGSSANALQGMAHLLRRA